MTARSTDYVIGIDIGGTYFRIGMVDQKRRLSNFIVEYSNILDKDNEQLKNLEKYIHSYIEKYGQGKLLAISIGFPSAVSKNKKMVLQSPNISGFDNIDVSTPLEAAFHVPSFVDNDVNNLLLYEIVERNLKNKGVTLGIYFGTGLGNAIYMNNHILEGKHGIAGELGHIPAIGKSDPCGCGNPGCMEIYASGKMLEALKEKYFTDTEIKNIFVRHGNEPVIQKYIETLSIPVAIEMNILDPDYIIVGGGVAGMNGFPRSDFEKNIYIHARKPYPAEDFEIIYAANNKESGVIGASYNIYMRLGMNI